MRTLIVVALLLLPTSLSAEETFNTPVELGVEFLGETLTGRYWDRIMWFELDYNIESSFTDRILMTWPVFSRGIDCPWRGGLMAVPQMWESYDSWRLGHDPVRGDEYYLALQYLTETVDARLFIPVARGENVEPLEPRIELKEFRLLKLNKHIELFARGFATLDEYDLNFGAAFTLGHFEAKVFSNFDDLRWSVGYKAETNTLF